MSKESKEVQAVADMTHMIRLAEIMAFLRGPDGCDWDRQQDFRSIAPYTIEEAYEVADAIDQNNMGELKEELGDLLLQVVFHARMAEEAGLFALDDVAAAICDKLERRHPHLFADRADGDKDVRQSWEELKAAEQTRASALDGVTLGLPALMRARKISDRAARVGFDWPDKAGPRAKIIEELAELEAESSHDRQEDEAGDLLFATVNYLRHLGVDAETALRRATAKFEQRFRHMETDPAFADADLDGKEKMWRKTKAELKAR